MPPERLQLIRTLAMYNHYSLIPATLISSSISLEEKDQLLTIHSETIWRCMRKHRRPRRSSKYQECCCKTLTWHKHCHLSVLSTCEWQPGICLEHTLECWGKEDASPALLWNKTGKGEGHEYLNNGFWKNDPQKLSGPLKKNSDALGNALAPENAGSPHFKEINYASRAGATPLILSWCNIIIWQHWKEKKTMKRSPRDLQCRKMCRVGSPPVATGSSVQDLTGGQKKVVFSVLATCFRSLQWQKGKSLLEKARQSRQLQQYRHQGC